MDLIELKGDMISLHFDLEKGNWSCYYKDELFLDNAYSYPISGERLEDTTSYEVHQRGEISDDLGRGKRLTLRRSLGPLLFEITFTIYEERELFTVESIISNASEEALTLPQIVLADALDENSGELIFGDDPTNCKVLPSDLERCYANCYARSVKDGFSLKSWWSLALTDELTKAGLIIGIIEPGDGELSLDLGYKEGDKGGFDLSIREGFFSDNSVFPGGYVVKDWSDRKPVLLRGGSSLKTGKVAFFFNSNVFAGLEEYAQLVRIYNHIRIPSDAPVGWFGVYSVKERKFPRGGMTEEQVINSADFIAQNLRDFGMNYLKIGVESMGSSLPFLKSAFIPDWKDMPSLRRTFNSDYSGRLSLARDGFPHGLRWLTEEIHKRGLKAALQTRPFFDIKDCSDPEVIKWIAEFYRILAEDWHFDYLMLDFNEWERNNEDPTETLVQVSRKLYEAIREGAGEKALLEGCHINLSASLGIVDTYRVGDDVRCERYEFGLKSLASRYYLNRDFWIGDVEYFDPAEKPFPLTKEWQQISSLAETQAWGSLVAITGGSLFTGGVLESLPEERLDILKRVIPVYGASARPIDLFEREYPCIWNLNIEKDFGSWNIVGLFNWYLSRPERLEIEFEDLGLKSSTDYILFDYWGHRFLGEFRDKFTAIIPPRSGFLLAVHEKPECPKVISTNRHVTQGGIDLEALNWDEDSNTLSGKSKVVANFDYILSVYIPRGYQVEKVEVSNLIYKLEKISASLVELSFKSPLSDVIEWSLEFREVETLEAQPKRQVYLGDNNLWEEWLSKVIDLSGEWNCKVDSEDKGSAEEWFRSDYDDSDWLSRAIPEEAKLEGEIIWYRKRFELPEQFKEELLHFSTDKIEGLDKVYLNGVCIGQMDVKGRDSWRRKRIERVYEIPRDIINYDGENVLAIRVRDVSDDGALTQEIRINP